MTKDQYILYGASGHGKVILDILETQLKKVACFVDDNTAMHAFEDLPVITHELLKSKSGLVIISIGDNGIRKKIAEDLIHKTFGCAVHPRAVIAAKTKIGNGTVVMAGAVINPSVTIGNHVIINTSASIDHDCVVEDYAHISPNATLCGNVLVGEGTHVGAGAVIIPGIKIGKWCKIGAGAVVIRNVPDNVTVIGNPATAINRKVIK